MMKPPVIYTVLALLLLPLTLWANETNELQQLRKEVASLNQRLDTLEKKPEGLSQEKIDWLNRIQFKADFRARYENDQLDGETDKNSMRFRARVGLYGTLTDELYSGIRIASGASDQPISANQDFRNWAAQKKVWIDLAYAGYNPSFIPGLDLSVGKILKPWIAIDSMYWDGDVNVEGGSLIYKRAFDALDLFAHGGYFIMYEDPARVNDDVSLTSAQLAGTFKLTDQFTWQLGTTAFIWDHIDGAEPPYGVFNGNTANGTVYGTGFQIGHVFTDIRLKAAPAAFRLFAEASKNYDSVDHQDQAWLAGGEISGEKWAIKYNYRDMENNSTLAYYTDFANNIIAKGHFIAARYDVHKHCSLALYYKNATCYDDVDFESILFDIVVKY